jgi:hypothetical protein
MAGLLTPPDDLYRAISEFLLEHSINNTIMTEHEPPVIYIQRFQTLIRANGQYLVAEVITDIDCDVETAKTSIDLSDPQSLDHLIDFIRRREVDGDRRTKGVWRL